MLWDKEIRKKLSKEVDELTNILEIIGKWKFMVLFGEVSVFLALFDMIRNVDYTIDIGGKLVSDLNSMIDKARKDFLESGQRGILGWAVYGSVASTTGWVMKGNNLSSASLTDIVGWLLDENFESFSDEKCHFEELRSNMGIFRAKNDKTVYENSEQHQKYIEDFAEEKRVELHQLVSDIKELGYIFEKDILSLKRCNSMLREGVKKKGNRFGFLEEEWKIIEKSIEAVGRIEKIINLKMLDGDIILTDEAKEILFDV